MRFLSERNIEIHKEYLNTLIHRYSIFEKSYPILAGKDIFGIYKTKIPRCERDAAAKLYSEILAHKIYFNSFSDRKLRADRIKNQYSSLETFLYYVSEECKKTSGGFLFVCDDGIKISLEVTDNYEKAFMSKRVALGLDLCEHAYFYDYGFDREKYVLNAISHFDFTKIEKSMN